MNKRDRMKEQILRHGFNLRRIFFPDDSSISPVGLAKSVHRLEVRAHRLAEEECNTGNVPEDWEDKILKSLDKVLNFRAQGIPVFVNGDPRGYALKIDDKYVRENNLEIHRDWGGYGILAPEFDGN
ncbi:MAG: hypothetical protein M0R74_15710 [Dehalococcoidia bacterium]|nr:hypothetical protein [Dehalococcoidia bacterium]